MRASPRNHFTKWSILVDTFESISEAMRLVRAIEAGDDVHQGAVRLEHSAIWTVYIRNVLPLHSFAWPDGMGPADERSVGDVRRMVGGAVG